MLVLVSSWLDIQFSACQIKRQLCNGTASDVEMFIEIGDWCRSTKIIQPNEAISFIQEAIPGLS